MLKPARGTHRGRALFAAAHAHQPVVRPQLAILPRPQPGALVALDEHGAEVSRFALLTGAKRLGRGTSGRGTAKGATI